MKPCIGPFVFLIIFHLEAVIGIENVEGVSGLTAELPCYLTSPDPNDRAILALWYKQGRRLPVYSYDARGTEERHQIDQDALENRANFKTSPSTSPAMLVLKPVKEKDSGIYTCRVDYYTSPTHNTVVNLTIIEPPENMTIYDQQGNVIGTRTSPINEGSPLHLSCVVNGGHPPPTVRWYTDNHSEFTSTHVTKVGQIQTDLKIPEVTRAYHNQVCICEAKNNNQQPPMSRKVIIDMNLRPLSTTIKVPSDPLIAGVQYSITCESKGSKPPSTIKWFLEGEQIDVAQTHTRASSGEVTSGVVNFVPKEKDHNKSLKCLASNPAIDGSDISSVVRLNVHYPPIVSLELGPNLNPKEIKQGGDVYFECQVKANPKPYKVSWFKDGQEIHQNVSRGILVTEKSLVLQKVHRKSAGEFTCRASNTQGTQASNPVRLDIMFSPECLMDQPVVFAVGRGETVNISCEVASNPLKAMFHWQLNGSERSYSSPGKAYQGHLISHYIFVGTLDKDYGSLLCWANNTVGTQEEACIFNIIPAGPPSPPENCEILNHTAENIDVTCDKGFDGGLAQAFLAEVYDEGGSLHLNITADDPLFSVDKLRPATTYVIRVRSFNAKGRSAYIPLTAYTLKVAEKRMGETESLLSSPLILIFVGILGGFIFIIIVLVFVTRWRKNITNSAVTVRRAPSPTLPKEPVAVTTTSPTTTISPTKPVNSETYVETRERIPVIGITSPDVEPVIEKAKIKPKKQVMVVENGKIERPGMSSASPTESPTIRDSFLGRQKDDCFLPNGSAGYYNSIGKASLGSSSSGHYKSHPSSTSPYSSPTYSSSAYPSPGYGASVLPHSHHHPHGSLQMPHTRTLPAQPTNHPRVISGLTPLQEDYVASSASYHYNYSTLPRKRGSHGEYLRGDDRDRCAGRQSASVEDRYHLMHEWKGNPKYLIRTRDREIDDESFV